MENHKIIASVLLLILCVLSVTSCSKDRVSTIYLRVYDVQDTAPRVINLPENKQWQKKLIKETVADVLKYGSSEITPQVGLFDGIGKLQTKKYFIKKEADGSYILYAGISDINELAGPISSSGYDRLVDIAVYSIISDLAYYDIGMPEK